MTKEATERITFISHGTTDKGLMRDNNEDALWYSSDLGVFLVADGLGGLPDGEMASQIAVDVFSKEIKNNNFNLEDIIRKANEAIHKQGILKLKNPHDLGMATTFTSGIIEGKRLKVVHAGDSGVFLWRRRNLKKVTGDDTMEAEFLAKMQPGTKVEMPQFYKNSLTRCLGPRDTIEFSVYEEELQSGDKVLFFTDGLTKGIEESVLQKEVGTATDPRELVYSLIMQANEAGGQDNCTVIAIFIL